MAPAGTPAGYLALTFAWSWACWTLVPAINPQLPGLATLLMFVGSFGPSLAAIVVVASTTKWWICAPGCHAASSGALDGDGWPSPFFPLAVMSTAAGLHIALGGAIAPSPASGHLLMTMVNFFLVLLVGGPLGEEFGWRGYALPTLQDRFGWRTASLALGLRWGMWHLPWLFIEGTAQAHIVLALFLPSVVAMSVLFAWLVNHTAGSGAAVLLFHTAINFWSSVVPVLPSEQGYRAYGLAGNACAAGGGAVGAAWRG